MLPYGSGVKREHTKCSEALLARHGAPGIVRARLVDEPRRTVLEAREVEADGEDPRDLREV